MVKGYDKFGKNGGQMNARHYAHNDYYEKGHTIPGIAFGKLSQELGVENGRPIDDKAFRALSANRHPVTEKQLTREVPGRKPFCDMTCSAPKTFSVAGIVGNDERVVGYHRKAVAKVQAELERIVGRQAHNKKEHLERTRNLSGVAYEHDSNRCQEVQLHTHLILWNVSRAENGKLYAIDYREFMDQSPYLTAVYRDELARAAIADGLNITFGEHGQPEIAELVNMAKEHQQRSDELDVLVERIEEHAGTKLTDREVGIIVRASRGLDVDKFERLWDAKKAELDQLKTLDPDTAENDRRELLKRFSEIVRECSESDLRKISTAEVRAEQQARVTAEQRQTLEAIKRSARPREIAVHDLDKSITYAIEHCFQNESVVKDYELYETVLQHAQGAGVDLAEMRAKLAIHPGLILGTHSEIGPADHYRRELESANWIREGKGKGNAILREDNNDHLSKQQRKAVKSLLESRDQFTVLSGSSGVGKTKYVIAPVIEQNLKALHKVFVVAPSDDARDVLREAADQLSPDSSAVAVLKRVESLQLFQADSRLHNQLAAGDLLIVDEASFISLKQGHAELERCSKRGVRVLLVGDLDQGKSIEAGDFFRLAIKSGVHCAELHDIKRQSPTALDGHYLKAVKLFKAGRTTEAFRELHQAGCIRESKGEDRVGTIADEIIKSEAAGIFAMAVNISHRENDAIAAAVRSRMKALGQLSDERTITAYQTLGWSDAQKKDVIKIKSGHVLEITRGKDKGAAWTVIDQHDGKLYAKNSGGEVRTFTGAHYKLFDVCEARQLKVATGDKLLSRSANKKANVINGALLTTAGWDDRGNPITSDGRSITHRNLCHAYSSTIRKVQGSSAMKVIVGFDRHSIRSASRDAAYVACSRGRQFCEVHVENISDLSQIQNRSGDRKLAIEMTVQALPRDLRELQTKIENGTRDRISARELMGKALKAMKQGLPDLQEHARLGAMRMQEQNGYGIER
jgi:conjugative relaxase-like TrwC/TraI family protein